MGEVPLYKGGANSAHIRQSEPDSGPGVGLQILHTFSSCPFFTLQRIAVQGYLAHKKPTPPRTLQ